MPGKPGGPPGRDMPPDREGSGKASSLPSQHLQRGVWAKLAHACPPRTVGPTAGERERNRKCSVGCVCSFRKQGFSRAFQALAGGRAPVSVRAGPH